MTPGEYVRLNLDRVNSRSAERPQRQWVYFIRQQLGSTMRGTDSTSETAGTARDGDAGPKIQRSKIKIVDCCAASGAWSLGAGGVTCGHRV